MQPAAKAPKKYLEGKLFLKFLERNKFTELEAEWEYQKNKVTLETDNL